MQPKPFAHLDSAGIARALAQIADHPGDLVDAFFERREEVELPAEDREPGVRARREVGFAVRIQRDGRTWLAGRDGLGRELFGDALRRIARAMPRAPYPLPEIHDEPWAEAPSVSELAELPPLVQRAVRGHRVDVPLRLTLCRHRRWLRIIGTQLASGTESESFYSAVVELPWMRFGTLLPALGEGAAEQLALSVARAWRARDAPPPAPWSGPCVLGSAATAVLLHEAVAHALEADTLALGGHPEAAVGVQMGSEALDVFDDPGGAPPGVRRAADDEGFPVVRRCLLRAGVVEQPLCDVFWSRRSEVLSAGGGRRGNRYTPPGPRSTHLELAPGELAPQDLLSDAEGGLYLPEVERGRLDPLTGELVLRFPYGRRIEKHVPGSPVGPCTLRAQVSDVLAAVVGVGREQRSAGAGWCAKSGVKLPVWATAPELRLEGIEVGS